MKFLFVHSWQGFCLAEWYLREAIKNHCGTEVEFRSVDIPCNGLPANDNLQRILFSWEPDIIGFSCHYWSLHSFLETSHWIKEISPQTVTILGGPQVNSINAASSILKSYKTIDYIIRGAGEEAACRLFDSLMLKNPLKSVTGLSFREKGKIVHNIPSVSRQTRELIFHQGNKPLSDQAAHLNEISYETTRGCYSRCAYCYYPLDKFEIYDDERTLAELSYICSLNIKNLRICDTHFGGTGPRAKKILRHLKKTNKKTSIKIYPDLNHIDHEYLELVRESGACITSIGIQTTNPTALKKINRAPSHTFHKQISLILSEFPEVPADLIIGLPGDNIKGLEKSFHDILMLGFTEVNLFRLMIFPGTELSENLAKFYDVKKLIISHQGQLISSPDFPEDVQKKISCFICAIEIICWIVRTGTLKLTPSERVFKFKNLISGIDPDLLIDLYQNIPKGSYPVNEDRIKRIGKAIKKVFKDYNI
jgi:radical SAM superfamily enzyme YgiQ (UPF0313 family)